ncbi:hypothetical protein L5515_015736 [Caenorhabditis briggsae]|uniref:C3H1-type domain-containing protein n=2 Tax=Caenorhabditis briggsae TaxID=6238 RepID=A0AAE9JAC5_CAEBR|nr:hypothetical protein L5515_015736 [Caenorhabditis briggsae]
MNNKKFMDPSAPTTPNHMFEEEKPNHVHMIEKFRVDHCMLFEQRKCHNHKPFTCFNWHYENQRRRVPILNPDGSFNYSPDVYCNEYEEKNGVCSNGDGCKYLHRVSGDVERKYHPRYFKTAMCVHSTNSKGHCAKNGPFCAYAHSERDRRPPTVGYYDSGQITEWTRSRKNSRASVIDEDEQWNGHEFVVLNYKTEFCRKPVSYCRQGYACPFYHNSKDRRRSPAVFKYRTTACPSAKPNNEWEDPDMCAGGDNCQYCHTRTEQQFHPEVYKSMKCNDLLEYGFCPRGIFCAFSHNEMEKYPLRDVYMRGELGLENDVPISPKPYGGPNENLGSSNLTSPSLYWRPENEELPDFMALSLNDGPNGPSGQNGPQEGFPPDHNDVNQRCLYLEESLRNMNECAQMWKARFEAVTVENSRIMEFINSMGPINSEPRPLSISIPQEDGIRPLASLAHSPDFDIFAQQDSNDPPACMRCGRDPTSPIPDGPKKCPLCSG